MPRSPPPAREGSHHAHPDRGRGRRDDRQLRTRSPSPTTRPRVVPAVPERRSASPDGEPRRADRARSHHRHRRERNRSRRASEAVSGHVALPFSARMLSKSDYRAFEPLFAYYLDLQKQRCLGDMDEREARGRWKSFVGKWNRNELAEGWYDPDMFAKCAMADRSPPGEACARRDERDERDGPPEEIPGGREATSATGDSDDDDDDDEDYGPALPSSDPWRKVVGARAPTFQDLSLRNELAEEQRAGDREELRRARKADRAVQKERLEELVPRAEPGSRERRLEKKREVNDKMRQWRDTSPGLEGGDDRQLMGEGDGLEELKRARKREQKRKSERQLQREEFERAKAEEMKERRRAWQQREEGTVSMLRELARQRFG
ncbi:uncharacterized protein MAM_00736 [Metarhizium album ARSEF 1941]|uniref:RNA helicase HEL117-like protein n=1 Tax=Metarhizium album (strain ARSEF 1941) TaxID=1081103 RepID=A0A0B2X8C2_METAS|nr:uncharacterized protein MAM_00736 [Metarhizium album ARSEF 1941]KHO01735.1 hypothetical protein MAM_00736 [Metarhizium album ARSEF 1941]